MLRTIKAKLFLFRGCDDGAVTVDWVVLTAAIVGLSIAVLSQVAVGATTAGDKMEDCARIIGNQMVRDHNANRRSYEWRLARAQRNCGRL